MFYFDPHEQEIHLSDDDVFHVVLLLVILELNMQTLFDADFHLDCGQCGRGGFHFLYQEILLLHVVAVIVPRHSDADKIPAWGLGVAQVCFGASPYIRSEAGWGPLEEQASIDSTNQTHARIKADVNTQEAKPAMAGLDTSALYIMFHSRRAGVSG